MTVLQVVPSYLPAHRYGGTIYTVHGLSKALAARGHEVHVFTTNVDGGRDSDVVLGRPVYLDGVRVWYFSSGPARRLYWSWPMRKALRQHIRDFDVVHLHSVFLWPTLCAARLARWAELPYIVSPHGMLVKALIDRKSRWIKLAWITLFERRTLEQAAGIHVTTEVEAEELRRFKLKTPPLSVIPYGCDLAAENDGCVPPRNPRMILFLGRINWKKGIDRLVRALVHVPQGLVVLAGHDNEGYFGEIDRLARACQVRDRIELIGPVYGARKDELLKEAAVLALPSYSENFGNVVLEAMAAGCPVIVTPEVGLAKVVQRYGTGRVADGHPEVFGHALQRLLDSPAEREAMGRRGNEAVRRHFEWSSIANQMELIYRQATGPVTARPRPRL